ncbi:PepSY-like domain-containing protein [Flavobacterium piscisymbiosum]|uniref:PepSY-like domain-containing protein n=1 Tax=Flavobacterium piscisymbiosum TaxID=2893753 RepID=A0ABS8M7N5_9FLAO|nr:PepSY-like domain-containing protein [Flavobacterium sp. F-30]MCC9061521.1 PepSY-like domain-containing protein [Flavobacterium sp. F-30]
MKKIILTGFIALSLLFSTTSCDNDDDHESVINASELPASASAFVTTYFPGVNYQIIKKQNQADADGSIYDVYLTNGFEIDFDANGNWVDIDGNHQAIPAELIPEKIQTYITVNYPNQFVIAIDNEKTFIEIDLSNNLELIFDTQGNFVRIDH